MTHPIVEAVAESLSENWPEMRIGSPSMATTLAAEIVAEVLRLAREPSEKQASLMHLAGPLPPMRAPQEHYVIAWRAGIDALLREVEG